MKSTLFGLVCVIASVEGTYRRPPLVTTYAKATPKTAHHPGCHGALCHVTIPQFNQVKPLDARRTIVPTPAVFHSHGLIQVEAPPKLSVAPREIAANFALETNNRGKVVERTEPTYFCKKPGFVLEGVDCVQTLFETPKTVCPGGFDTLGEDCVRRATFLQTCPAGYIKKDGHCAKLITQAFIELCPEGTVEAEGVTAQGGPVCHRQVQHPLTPTCPDGSYDGVSGNCIVTVFEDAKAYCPEGFIFDEKDGLCLQEEIYDCSHQPLVLETIPQLGVTQITPVHATQITPVHSHKVNRYHTHPRGRALTTRLSHIARVETTPHIARVEATPPCVEMEAVKPCNVQPCVQQRALPPPCEAKPKVMVQPTKTTISVQKTCTRVTSTALVFDCEEGLLQGQRCLVRQTVSPVPVCKAEGNEEFCYTLQRTHPLQECPEGFTKECAMGRPCQCVALEAAAFISSCPSGYSTGLDGCERTTAAQTICPLGYALQGDSCVRVLKEPADCVFSVTYECDRSTNGECI